MLETLLIVHTLVAGATALAAWGLRHAPRALFELRADATLFSVTSNGTFLASMALAVAAAPGAYLCTVRSNPPHVHQRFAAMLDGQRPRRSRPATVSRAVQTDRRTRRWRLRSSC